MSAPKRAIGAKATVPDAKRSAPLPAAAPPLVHVDPNRVRELRAPSAAPSSQQRCTTVLYWMSRDQRAQDNWALLYAHQLAQREGMSLVVAFVLRTAFCGQSGWRHWDFMLRGLREVADTLWSSWKIPFHLVRSSSSSSVSPAAAAAASSSSPPPDDAEQQFIELIQQLGVRHVVTDFSPLREGVVWRSRVAASLAPHCSLTQVDAHNVVPCWLVSDHAEYMARTIRPKIESRFAQYLVEFPPQPLAPPSANVLETAPVQPRIDWDDVMSRTRALCDQTVAPVRWCVPGPAAGQQQAAAFVRERLRTYNSDRNQLTKKSSELSPYLHYGHISKQALAFAARRAGSGEGAAAFVEELVVRAELAENFCFYNKHYDTFEGLADWAKETLRQHQGDKREWIYSRAQLDAGETHDDVWNAAQHQLRYVGKMQGYIRMYWAKKILEWTATPDDAIAIAQWLNDRYSLDGRDPNGFAGVMWAIGGVHDRGWTERAIFGKIRFMNYAGLQRKFDVPGYIAMVKAEVAHEAEATGKAGSRSGALSSVTPWSLASSSASRRK